MQALEHEGKSLRDFVSEVPEYVTLREKVAVQNEKKYLLVDQLSKTIAGNFADHGELSTVDGVRLALSDDGY